MPTNVVMPQLGESVVEGVVVKWRVKEGDQVKADDPIAEVETDKATTEVPSPATGRVLRLLVKEGQTIGVGKPILEIADASEAAASAPKAAAPATKAPASADDGETAGSAPVQVPVSAPLVLKAPARAAAPASAPAPGAARYDDARISPVVRKMADEYKLDLSQIRGTGDGGRITKKDVQAYLAQPQGQRAQPQNGAAPTPIAAPARAPAPMAGDEVVPFTRRRRVIAERMSLSRRTIPEVTTFSEVDMSKIAAVRARYKASGGKAPGATKLTYLPFICAAAVRALRDYPIVNAQIVSQGGEPGGDAYVLKKDINLGVAVDTEEGLIVPVIKRADELSLLGLARVTDELGEKGRTGKITPDDMAGGTFTISNPGLRGNLFGTPIINLPQVGCLRMGEVVKRAVVVERDGEDTIAIRPMMYLAFAYDHRIVDGVPGNAFLHRVTELLEAGDFPL